MNLSWNSEEGVVSGNRYQINRVNTASKYMFWLIAKLSTRFLPKFTRELALMQRDCQFETKLFWIWFRQFREQTGTLPLTNITRQFLWPWSWNPESSLWLARWKNKACIPPTLLGKADEGTDQYAFDHSNNSTLLSVAPKKNKSVFLLSTMLSGKKDRRGYWKDEVNVFYNQEKRGVDSHDQMCSLFTTARKTKRWSMELFYGVIECAALNACYFHWKCAQLSRT